jgi:Fe-S-cluster-containing dehydrogenase component/formate-dependent nitrite reductase membrane component NrfD
MRYGFLIDHNRCIGCHACTVACKEEHDVPLGVYRTWVKYIEKGEFPDTRRYFGVLRCNHCDDAPCVEICPTVSLFRRSDGIVDFDGERCIGCKSCMQACPYDALYIDPRTQTAAKCNFCAHRIEAGLEPACVIVCPEQAIVSGDLDDRESKISRIVATQKVSMRKPGKGTKPKLFYTGIDEDLLQPTMIEPQSSHLWAEKAPAEDLYAAVQEHNQRKAAGTAREVYDVSHPQLWGRNIASYLCTKSIAAGVLMVAAFLLQSGFESERWLLNVASPALALLFLAATTFLLVVDLKRPERFYYLLTKPNLKSWLVLGGYILIVYGAVAFVWLSIGLAGNAPPKLLVLLAVALAAGAAGYSAFLFAQAKGRDLWQSPLFLWHLLVQAVVAGAATLLLAGLATGGSPDHFEALGRVLFVALLLSFAMILGEACQKHMSEDVTRATDLLKKGALRKSFWGGAIGLGTVLPLALLGLSAEVSSSAYALASIAALAGLWIFEDLWIKAGQSVPLS